MSSGFVTETEALDIRKKRQEEWEKVRTAADPIERPEEPYDNRSLYDRLQEQKHKKDLEYEEAHKLKNMIKGLDDDEIDFLDLVDRTKLAADRMKTQEEEKELNDFRNRVATLQEKALDQKLASGAAKPKSTMQGPKRSQHTLLQGVVVKKPGGDRKRKLDDAEGNETEPQGKAQTPMELENGKMNTSRAQKPVASAVVVAKRRINTGLQCVGILPGLGNYQHSSSDTSDSESDSEGEHGETEKRDFLGRKIVEKQESQD